MLAALNTQDEKINAVQAMKGDEYYCPVCGEKLVFKKGEIKIPHFAHEPKSSCTWNSWEPESKRHQVMKYLLMTKISEHNKCSVSDYEHIIDKYIADVYFEIDGTKIAVECQCSPKSLKEFIEKTRAYTDNDVHTLWIYDFPMKWFKGETRLENEVRPSAIMNESHRWYYGKIYAVYERDLVGIHFNPVFREYEAWDKEEFNGCNYDDCFYSYDKVLKSVKQPDVRVIPDWELVFYENNGLKYSNDYYLLAKFNDYKWW